LKCNGQQAGEKLCLEKRSNNGGTVSLSDRHHGAINNKAKLKATEVEERKAKEDIEEEEGKKSN